MNLPQRLILPLAALAVTGAAVLGAQAVSAATEPVGTSLAQKLATTFNLDQAKVQAVLDQHHSEHQANKTARYEQRLTQAVAAGHLTEAQKTALLDKVKDLKTKLEAAKANPGADRHAAIAAIHQEATDWAKAQGINPKWLPFGPAHHHGGSRHPHGPAPLDHP